MTGTTERDAEIERLVLMQTATTIGAALEGTRRPGQGVIGLASIAHLLRERKLICFDGQREHRKDILTTPAAFLEEHGHGVDRVLDTSKRNSARYDEAVGRRDFNAIRDALRAQAAAVHPKVGREGGGPLDGWYAIEWCEVGVKDTETERTVQKKTAVIIGLDGYAEADNAAERIRNELDYELDTRPGQRSRKVIRSTGIMPGEDRGSRLVDAISRTRFLMERPGRRIAWIRPANVLMNLPDAALVTMNTCSGILRGMRRIYPAGQPKDLNTRRTRR